MDNRSENVRGGEGPMEKPMDKVPGKYTVNETAQPREGFHEELTPAPPDNAGDLSKRFS